MRSLDWGTCNACAMEATRREQGVTRKPAGRSNGPADAARAGLASLANVRDELKSDRVVAELERQILGGRLTAGMRLPTEGELCELLGVSRSVVRDAIRSLVARGLVAVRQGQGMTVAEANDDAFSHALIILLARSDLTMGDVVSARETIETRLISLAATNATEEDCEELELQCARFAAAVDDGDWDLARDTHLTFHVGLLKALHQPALELFLKPMTEIIMVSSAPPRLTAREDWEVGTHPPILEALRRGDPIGAEEAMREHFVATSEPRRYKSFHAQRFSSVFTEAPWARP